MSDKVVVGARFVIARPDEILSPGQVVIEQGVIKEVCSRVLYKNDIDLQDAAILPGLVNPHTHLEFSEFEKPLDAGANFPQWIGSVVAHRRRLEETFTSPEELAEYRKQVYLSGYTESRRFGVQTIADIVTPPWNPSWLAGEYSSDESCPRVLPMPELLGLQEEQFKRSAQWCGSAIEQTNGMAASENSVYFPAAISPHSPYSTIAGELQKELKRIRVPIAAMHVAESREELDWVNHGTGPFRDAFERIGVPLNQPRLDVGECINLLKSFQHALLVHGNYLTNEQLQQVAEAKNCLSLVYCPRTHEHFSHERYPLDQARKLGIRVVLGTDSRASSPDLNLWADLVSATSTHGIPPADAVAMVTSSAAEALGLESECGAIAPGLRAAFSYSPVPESITTSGVLEYLTHEVGALQPLEIS